MEQFEGKKKSSIFQPFKLVFSKLSYITLAFFVALVILFVSIWLPSRHILIYFFTSGNFDLGDKMELIASSLDFFRLNFTFSSKIITIILSILAGINIAMLVYFIKKRLALRRAAGAGVLSILGGFLGIGCVSCGSVILSSIFGLTATASFIGVLPLKGLELGLLGILILLLSIYILARKIRNHVVCEVKNVG